jgi:hypothetical protein
VTRIALATCSALPNLSPDDAPLLEAIASRGHDVDVVVWDDATVDWGGYDLVVIRSTWDYAQRRVEFLAWTERVQAVTELANSFPVVRWNTDKHYLSELEAAGIPVVPTIWLEPERHLTSRALHTRFPANGDFVIKPAVSAGSVDTGRYTAIDAGSRGLAIQHAKRLLDAGRTVMVQRYLKSVDTVGERAHVFILGEYSHSVLKGAMLHDSHVAVDLMYKEERISRITATDGEIEAARRVIDTARSLLTGDGVGVEVEPFLFARVDLVSGDDDEALLFELEMVEPTLFIDSSVHAQVRFVDAFLARAAGKA